MQFWLWLFWGLYIIFLFLPALIVSLLISQTVLFLLFPSSASSIETISSCISQRTQCSPYLRSASVSCRKVKNSHVQRGLLPSGLEDSFSLLQALSFHWSLGTFPSHKRALYSDSVLAIRRDKCSVLSLPLGCWQFSLENQSLLDSNTHSGGPCLGSLWATLGLLFCSALRISD